MIVSASPFFNELDLLEYRFRTMAEVVDMFVVAESPTTFSGLCKPLYFKENKARFARWESKIFHVILSGAKEGTTPTPWDREAWQREQLLCAVEAIDPEIAIFTDTDEIMRPECVERFRSSGLPRMRFDHDLLLYKLDRHDPTLRWQHGTIMQWHAGAIPEIRGGESPVITDSGWHFEYFGGRDLLLEKLNATAHALDSCVPDFYRRVRAGEMPGIERCVPYPTEKLPAAMRANLETLRSKGWFS